MSEVLQKSVVVAVIIKDLYSIWDSLITYMHNSYEKKSVPIIVHEKELLINSN